MMRGKVWIPFLALLIFHEFGKTTSSVKKFGKTAASGFLRGRFGADFIFYQGGSKMDKDTVLQCPRGMIFLHKDGNPTCYNEQIEDQEVVDQGQEYILQLLLYSTNLTDSAESLKSNLDWPIFCKHFSRFANEMNNVSKVTNFQFNLGLFAESPQWWMKWNFSSIPLHLSINFEVEMNDTLFEDQIIDSVGKKIQVSLDGQDIEMNYKVFNGSYSMDVLVSGSIKADPSDWCSVEKRRVPATDVMPKSGNPVFHEMSCQYAELNEGDDYRVVEGGVRLMFKDLDEESEDLESSEYTFHGDGMVTVCWETYKRYKLETLNIIQKVQRQMGETVWIVNVLFLSCSLIALFSTFVTYCTFPILRTLPAKNNMGLIISLFMAQLMYIMGFRHTDNYVFCLTTAVALHYFWLAAIFWMTICCFHVFRGFVLSKTMSSTSETRSTTLYKYVSIAHGLPILIIITVVSLNLVLSDGTETGYVGRNCFLSSVLLNGLTVTLPLCVVLLSNFIFFSATICTISRTKQIRRCTGGERRNLWVYIKLSSITGLFWIVAILAAALQVRALEYVSTTLNSSQGVFLFVSYCCNKRVLTLWRKTFTSGARSMTSSGSGKTQQTHLET